VTHAVITRSEATKQSRFVACFATLAGDDGYTLAGDDGYTLAMRFEIDCSKKMYAYSKNAEVMDKLLYVYGKKALALHR